MASLAMMGPMVRSEVSSATSGLTKTLNARGVSTVASDCSGSAGTSSGASSNAAKVKTAAATTPAPMEVGKGGDGSQPSSSFVTKMVGGGMNTASATISGNGNGSNNTINTTNKNVTKVENTNDVKVNNVNAQGAFSGKATSWDNYSGGSASTGDSSNTNSTSTNVSISN